MAALLAAGVTYFFSKKLNARRAQHSSTQIVATTTELPSGGTLGAKEVAVLTAGQTSEPDPQGKPQTVNVVTVLLNPQDSQKLQLASAQGTIQFVLRNGVDQKSVEIRPTRLDQLAGIEKPPVVVPPSTKKAPRRADPPPRQMYVLEVIEGTKRSVEKF